jgi:p24 family protein gamma-2
VITCFASTTPSAFNSKTVFFELVIEDPNNPSDENDVISELEGLSPEEFYDMKVQDIMDIIHNVRTRISKVRQLQDMLKSFEARDRNLAELNCSRVNLFSIIIITTMIGVGFLQVFMIRSLFDTDPKGRRVWEKITKIVENIKQ